MLNRFRFVFKAMVDALLGKVEDPRTMLENTYEELEDELVAARKQFARDRAVESKLSKQIEELKEQNADPQTIAELNEKLLQHRFRLAKVANKVRRLEEELQRAYTKKHLLWERDAAGPGDPRLVGLLLLLVSFALVGISYGNFVAK